MDMLAALRFVQGAVAKKDVLPELTHFRITGGRITAYNGRIALSAPIGLQLDVTPKADAMLKAIRACTDTVAFHVTPAGKLALKSGKYRAYIECVQANLPMLEPEGERIDLHADFVAGLDRVAPFIALDASRQWAQGVLYANGALYATNNIVLVATFLGDVFPRPINIPKQTVQELLRIGEPPTHVTLAEQSITFHWEGDRWLRSCLYSVEWPPVDALLSVPMSAGAYTLTPEYFAAVRSLAPFVDAAGRVYHTAEGLSTSPGSEDGAHVDLCAFPELVLNIEHLLLLDGVAEQINFNTKPSRFRGNAVEGVINWMHA